MSQDLKARLYSCWVLESRSGEPLDLSEVLSLLEAIEHLGSITGACKVCNVSYRHAWGLLRKAEQQFACALIETSRRRGTSLTHFAQRLVWANRRVNARLAPTLESMASELQSELQRFLPEADEGLCLHASHGFAVEALLQLANEQGLLPLQLRYRTGSEALAALAQGECHLAGFQIAQGPLEARLLQAHIGVLHPDEHCLINLATRRTGLILGPDNALGITSVADLARPGVHFVNRQPGSSTRRLIDCLLHDANVDSKQVRGYDSNEFTHMAIAAHVASGMADAGIGIETAAQRFRLTFVPLAQERYFFAVNRHDLNMPAMQSLLALLGSSAFHTHLAGLAGYDASALGKIQTLAEAFPSTYEALPAATPALG